MKIMVANMTVARLARASQVNVLGSLVKSLHCNCKETFPSPPHFRRLFPSYAHGTSWELYKHVSLNLVELIWHGIKSINILDRN